MHRAARGDKKIPILFNCDPFAGSKRVCFISISEKEFTSSLADEVFYFISRESMLNQRGAGWCEVGCGGGGADITDIYKRNEKALGSVMKAWD